MDLIQKGSSAIDRYIKLIVPYVIIVIIIQLVCKSIGARLDYGTWIKWWDDNGGENYTSTFDIIAMAYFSKSKLLFNIRQLLTPGPTYLNYTDIMLLQTIVINNAKIKVDGNKNFPNNFVTPEHLCKGICWTNNDISIFREGIITSYNKAYWYPNWVKFGQPGPDDIELWAKVTGRTTNGFWPHQNGCYEFFDIPNGTNQGKSYNLTDFKAGSDTTAPGTGYYYIPGSTDYRGSWAQLFADFGIVYSTDQKVTTTKIPVVDPISKIDIWYNSGYSNGKYGLNFMGLYKINPSSYTLTSWVSKFYNDPTTGQKLDPQSFKNLIGISPGGLRQTQGGWLKFIKGINTELNSFDEIMNELFATYATNYTKVVLPHCDKGGAAMDAVGAFASMAAMAAMVPPGPATGVILVVACVMGTIAGLKGAKGC